MGINADAVLTSSDRCEGCIALADSCDVADCKQQMQSDRRQVTGLTECTAPADSWDVTGCKHQMQL